MISEPLRRSIARHYAMQRCPRFGSHRWARETEASTTVYCECYAELSVHAQAGFATTLDLSKVPVFPRQPLMYKYEPPPPIPIVVSNWQRDPVMLEPNPVMVRTTSDSEYWQDYRRGS